MVCASVGFSRDDRVLDGAKQGKFTYELLVFFAGSLSLVMSVCLFCGASNVISWLGYGRRRLESTSAESQIAQLQIELARLRAEAAAAATVPVDQPPPGLPPFGQSSPYSGLDADVAGSPLGAFGCFGQGADPAGPMFGGGAPAGHAATGSYPAGVYASAPPLPSLPSASTPSQMSASFLLSLLEGCFAWKSSLVPSFLECGRGRSGS